MTMSPAEFKCLRESMGLSTKWLAIRWNVAEFSIKRWEHIRFLPTEFEQDLLQLKHDFDQAVAAASETGSDSLLIVPRIELESSGVFPATWSRAIAQRAHERTGMKIVFREEGDSSKNTV